MSIKQARLEQRVLPPGPPEQCNSAEQLLYWLHLNCERYGLIYRATVYGRSVYVISARSIASRSFGETGRITREGVWSYNESLWPLAAT